jgi:hypothetical protein
MAHRPDHNLGLRHAIGEPDLVGWIDRVGMKVEARQTRLG